MSLGSGRFAAATCREAHAISAEARGLVEPAYRAAVDALPAGIRHIAGYHIGWWNTDGRPAGGAGKAVRPGLTLVCARAAGGDPSGRPVVDAAVAVELVHDFSLLHDDVMDGDLTRPRRLTAWAVFGVGLAILVGPPSRTAQASTSQTRELHRLRHDHGFIEIRDIDPACSTAPPRGSQEHE